MKIDHEPAFNSWVPHVLTNGTTCRQRTFDRSPANHHVCQQKTDRLAPTIAALNALEVKVGDVLSAYITAPTTEKV